MDNLANTDNKKHSEASEPSVKEQVKREFEYSADKGEPEREQIQTELGEPHYTLPSPMNSREDAAFKNITADQEGLAFGIANQRNEPLDMTEKMEKRDEDRWALNPASAQTDEDDPKDK